MTRETPGPPAKGRRRHLSVVCSKGVRQRFLRGMITHDLVQRGLAFEHAFGIARAIRDRLSDRQEVSTAELRDFIQDELHELLGPDLPPHLRVPLRPTPELHILRPGQRQPFSRGLVARSIHAAGLELDRAYELVTALVTELQEEGVKELPSEEVIRRVSRLIERHEGSEAAQRYRLVRRIHRLPRPLVIYVGGATGTGKSTLALELAPLLRVYRINSTDTIRQVMRMIFAPQVMPALHSSSFEVAPTIEELPLPGGGEDASHRLVSTYEEQAKRVLVGVRAVVERAIAENLNVIVEGVHLCPPLIPFSDLEGAVYQVPLVLGTLDQESHRERFLARARLGGRQAERYLQNFDAIRQVQDFILQRAEAHDVPLLDTSQGDATVMRSLRLVTSVLRQRLPDLDRDAWLARQPSPPTLLLIIDGMADRPVRALGGRTPLQAADTPNLDRLAREGRCGLADPVAPGVVPDTAQGCLALFGQSPLALKRGPVESLGAGIALRPGDVAMRGNLATLDAHGNVIDRRAGRIRDGAAELARALDRLSLPASQAEEVEFRVRPTTEHRLAIAMRGPGLSSAIEGSDPGEGSSPGPPITAQPHDPSDDSAVRTAQLLGLFEQEARRVLARHPVNKRRVREGLPPANAVLTRGPGRIHRLLPLEEAGMPLRMVCIGGDRTVLGLASWLGARTVTRPEMTANVDTDLAVKFRAAREALQDNDLVILHLKGADIAAHDMRPDLKASFLAAADEHLGRLLEEFAGPLRVAVAADHATLSESGQHAADPLPVLIWGHGIEPDSVEAFDERAAATGGLQRFPLQMLLGRLFDLR